MHNCSYCICYLWYSVRCWIHKLSEVHHAFSLVLGDVDALDWGKAGVGVPEVFQLELPLRQPGPGQLHKHLAGEKTVQTGLTAIGFYRLLYQISDQLLPCV